MGSVQPVFDGVVIDLPLQQNFAYLECSQTAVLWCLRSDHVQREVKHCMIDGISGVFALRVSF